MATYVNPAFRKFQNPRLGQYFEMKPWFAGGGGAEFNNRLDWARLPATDDQMNLAESTERSKAAHAAQQRASAMAAMADNDLLESATDDELSNLYGPPRTEREARLQRIVQEDLNARQRGTNLIPNERQKVAYEQSLANLKRTQLANYFDPLQFQLDQARFGETQDQNVFNRINQIAQRQHAAQQLTAQERFREIQRQNAVANLAQRERAQQANLGQRERFHGDTQANQSLSQMMQLERMLQDAADAEQRQRNFESTFNRGYFQDVATAANAGALPPTQMGQFASRFDPATMSILQGYSRLGAENAGFGATPETQSPGFLSRLGSMINPFGGSTAQTAPVDQWPDDGGDDSEGFDMGMGNPDFAPPVAAPSMAARPATPAPQGRRFVPGSTVRDLRTGRQFLVLPNGQFRPI